jgi:nitroreductase
MELTDAIELRRSIRRYKADAVPEGMIKSILHAGHMAPSAGNLQARDFIIITDEATRKKLCEAALNQQFIVDAPVCIVVCANMERSRKKYRSRGDMYALQDASIAAMTMLLQAFDLGLGTCWVGAFDERRVIEMFKLPLGVFPVAILPIGYPDESPLTPSRLNESIEHWGKW